MVEYNSSLFHSYFDNRLGHDLSHIVWHGIVNDPWISKKQNLVRRRSKLSIESLPSSVRLSSIFPPTVFMITIIMIRSTIYLHSTLPLFKSRAQTLINDMWDYKLLTNLAMQLQTPTSLEMRPYARPLQKLQTQRRCSFHNLRER